MSATCLVCSAGFAAAVTTTNLLINPGAETGDLTGWVLGGTSNPFAGSQSDSLGDQFVPHSGVGYFIGGTGADYGSLSQQVSLIGNQGITAAALDQGTLFAAISVWEQGLNQGNPSDNADIGLVFLDAHTNSLGATVTPIIDAHNGTWANYGNAYAIPVGTRYFLYTMNFNRHSGTDLDAFIDDNYLSVTDAAAPPRLAIARAGTGVVLSWVTAIPGFLLQENPQPGTTNWVNSTNQVAVSGSTNQVTVSPALGNKFYRLYHP
jgi:hypothetical protein